jgi:GTP cyclohydrolase I
MAEVLTAGYDEMILLRRIPFAATASTTWRPSLGHAWVGYVPRRRVVGISKLARVVEAYASRLQVQERLTAEIADTFEKILKPAGVGVAIKATHH